VRRKGRLLGAVAARYFGVLIRVPKYPCPPPPSVLEKEFALWYNACRMELRVAYVGSPRILVSCCGKPSIMVSTLGTASFDMIGCFRARS
jgi:hypothetical protein